MPIPVRLFVPTAESLKHLWDRLDGLRAGLGDEFPADPFAFVAWLDPATTRLFEFGPGEAPLGIGVFTAIEPGEAAWAHIFVWAERGTYPPGDLVTAARVACAGVMQAFGLVRINGLTPVTNVPARVFAERVGFRIEGRARKACRVNGMRVDGWLSGLLPEDLLAEPAAAKSRDTIDMTPVEVSV